MKLLIAWHVHNTEICGTGSQIISELNGKSLQRVVEFLNSTSCELEQEVRDNLFGRNRELLLSGPRLNQSGAHFGERFRQILGYLFNFLLPRRPCFLYQTSCSTQTSLGCANLIWAFTSRFLAPFELHFQSRNHGFAQDPNLSSKRRHPEFLRVAIQREDLLLEPQAEEVLVRRKNAHGTDMQFE